MKGFNGRKMIKIILDTDIGADCDDAGAYTVAAINSQFSNTSIQVKQE